VPPVSAARPARPSPLDGCRLAIAFQEVAEFDDAIDGLLSWFTSVLVFAAACWPRRICPLQFAMRSRHADASGLSRSSAPSSRSQGWIRRVAHRAPPGARSADLDSGGAGIEKVHGLSGSSLPEMVAARALTASTTPSSRMRTLCEASYLSRRPRSMRMVSASPGSSSLTSWKRRASAGFLSRSTSCT